MVLLALKQPPMDETQNQVPAVAPVTQSKKKIIIIGVVVVVGVIILQSIFSPERAAERIAEQALEDATGGSVDIDTDGAGSITVTDEDGSKIEISGEGAGKLPEGWLDSVPLSDDAAIEYAGTVSADGGKSMNVTYTSSESLENITALYTEALGKNGWTIEANLTTGEGTMLSATAEENTVAVYIEKTDAGTSVTLTVQVMQ